MKTNISHEINWKKCNYQQLSKSISCIFNGQSDAKTASIIDDYCQFVNALNELSNTPDWEVCLTDNYHDKIIKPAQEEARLRIADIREKVHHERMLKILENKLQGSSILKDKHEHWSKEKEFKASKRKKHYNTGVVFYETDFSRGRGATQVFVIVNDVYRLMIQLQNNQYRRCVILHPTKRGVKAKIDRICAGLNIIWNGYNHSNKYGELFKYQYDPITNKTVNDILDKIVSDLESIISNIKQLKNLR